MCMRVCVEFAQQKYNFQQQHRTTLQCSMFVPLDSRQARKANNQPHPGTADRVRTCRL
jgi:hypothetical protein